MSISASIKEGDLTPAVLAIPGFADYTRYYEVRFGKKRIDLLMISELDESWIAIEFKIRDWKRALWQSLVNREIADKCFVALYEKFVPAASSQRNLFEAYGVGLISVGESIASVVIPATVVHNLTRRRQQLLTSIELGIKKEDKDSC